MDSEPTEGAPGAAEAGDLAEMRAQIAGLTAAVAGIADRLGALTERIDAGPIDAGPIDTVRPDHADADAPTAPIAPAPPVMPASPAPHAPPVPHAPPAAQAPPMVPVPLPSAPPSAPPVPPAPAYPGTPSPAPGYPAFPAAGPAFPAAALAARPTPEGTPWADRTGSTILAWVGGGVTVLGIVLLLVIAAREGWIGPTERVAIGAVVGLALLGIGVVSHRDERRRTLAMVLTCTGIAILFLTTVAAVRWVGLLPPVAGFAISAAITGLAAVLAGTWRQPWLAGISFAAAALLAPAVGLGVTDQVLVFEAILVAGGAAALLAGVGHLAWIGAVATAVLVLVGGLAENDVTAVRIIVTVAIALVAWALMLGRWLTGTATADPGPFPIRPRTSDPDRMARDYADYHAHQARRSAAAFDRGTAAGSLIGVSALLVITLLAAHGSRLSTAAIGGLAAVLAALLVAVVAVGSRVPALSDTVAIVLAWITGLTLAAVALTLVVDRDADAVLGLVVLATAACLAAGTAGSVRLLIPALGLAGLAALLTAPVIDFFDLATWRPESIAPGWGAPDVLLARAWTEVLPAGLGVLALAAFGMWAVTRCVRPADEVDPPGGGIARGGPYRAAARARTAVLGWTFVTVAVVGAYGACTAVLIAAYLVSFSQAGLNGGQIAMTVLLTVTALVLLWQGFRQLALRVGGLVFAAIAVGKLMIVDTASLGDIARAVTFIGVGLLLLAGAGAYLRALGRHRAPAADGGAGGADAVAAAAPGPPHPGETS